MHFLLFYEFVPDYLDRRAQYRAEHLRSAWESQARGELVLAGALADPTDGAVLLFQGESDARARAFAADDPYVKAGLVTRWHVRAWTTVVGDDAMTPVRNVS
jgi:hypothetical protein